MNIDLLVLDNLSFLFTVINADYSQFKKTKYMSNCIKRYIFLVFNQVRNRLFS